ncbi:MAG: helix-turn-helix domain-containing protein [Paracoccaceae bacterium]
MARESLTGSRIRERRTMAGLKQADLARRAGISPSYLNLIEHNRRRIGGRLLQDVAAALDVEPSLLSEGAEAALIAALREAAGARPAIAAELDRVEEFAGRFPGWAELLADARRRAEALERTVETLSDRLAHDPHLAASLHEMLSAITAIRSTAAILADTTELEPEWRDRFHRNLDQDSRRLAEGGAALVGYLDSAGEAGASPTSPQEEVDAFLAARGYHFPELEKPGAQPADVLAREATERALSSRAARVMAERLLARYRDDAARMPLRRVARVLTAHGPDPEALARACGADLAAAMRRLAALPRDMTEDPFGLAICDASGTLTFRKPLDDFPLPRFGAACPWWPLFEALGRPGQPVARLMEQAGRETRRFRGLAVANPVAPAGFERPALTEAHMLILPDGGASGPLLEVGPGCRVCPRETCLGRREPSILADGF